MEDGVTPNSRPVRFGFDQREFPDFSWRGYAVMSPAQVRTRGVPSVLKVVTRGYFLSQSVLTVIGWL